MAIKCILTEQGGGAGPGFELHSIKITTPPSKTAYISGQAFDSTGMVVTASYAIKGVIIAETPVAGYSVSPSILTDEVTKVTITYSEGGVSCTATQNVSVTHALVSITTTAPTTTTYEYGDTFNKAGMTVTAHYSDKKTATVTSWTHSPTTLNKVGTQAITVSYTENGITKTTSTNVTVNRKTVPIPTQKDSLTYNSNTQSPSWNNYNTSHMTIGGTTSSINAGTYTATFTPGANYRWPDGSTTAKNVNWQIGKATGTLSLSSSSVSINGSNYTGVTVTVTTNSNGTITASSNNTAAATVSVSGKTITIKGDGKTAGQATITVEVAATNNYTAPAAKTITVDVVYFTWGSEDAIADASWFQGLKGWVASATNSELSACVGKCKKVTLSTSVLGTTTHYIRCIGYNLDRDINNTTRNTLTFQTKNMLNNLLPQFGTDSTRALWIGSMARSGCQSYYNAFPGKNYIATVSKGTSTACNGSRDNDVVYNNETVFLPSEGEMGLDSFSPSNKEFCKQNTSNTPYQYYTDNNKRIKNLGDSGSEVYYWERSRCYNSSISDGVCIVGSSGNANWNNWSNSSGGLAPALVI